jgi:hypothetical protein
MRVKGGKIKMRLIDARAKAMRKSLKYSCWVVFDGKDSMAGNEYSVIDALETRQVSADNFVELWINGQSHYNRLHIFQN